MGTYVNDNLGKNEEVVYEANLHWITFISIPALLTLFIAPIIDRWTSEFAVTNKRVIIKVGLLRRRTLEMNLSKIESINVNQSIIGRILRYGDILVIGTGGTRELFPSIGAPIKFRKAYQDAEADL